MWVRTNCSSLRNSSSLKYKITFSCKERKLYTHIMLKYHNEISRDRIELGINLVNDDFYNKLVQALGSKYTLWKAKGNEHVVSQIQLDLKTLDKSELDEILSIINKVTPTLLSTEALSTAFSDILTKVIPTNK